MQKLKFTIGEEFDGAKLEHFLRSKGMSSRTLKRLKHTENGMTRNGVHIRSVDILKKGDVILLCFIDAAPLKPAFNIEFDIVYEDSEYIVCNKNGDLPTHPSLAYSTYSLASGIAGYLQSKGHSQTIRVINRLDKDTSGLVLIAKHQFASSIVGAYLKKTYIALVEGKLETSGTIDAPIRKRDEESKMRIVAEHGERAVTHYSIIESNEQATLVKVQLETGRTHQIRVHFGHIGHPLIGDLLYGTADESIPRQALHCYKLTFHNKITKKEIKTIAELPKDFKNALQKYKINENIGEKL